MAKHHIMGGSLEINGTTVTAGVHVGPNEFVPTNIRYVQGDTSDSLPGETVVQFMGRIYENSTGCLVRGNFRMNQAAY